MKKKYLYSSRKNFFLLIFFFQGTYCFDALGCKDILELLYMAFDINSIVKRNIYNTYGSEGIVTRSVITTPIQLYYWNSNALADHFSVNVFYLGISDGVVFGNKGNTLSSLVKFEGVSNLYNEFAYDILDNTSYSIVDIPYLLKSFDFLKILQRRAGAVIDASYFFSNDIFCYTQIPFVYKVYYPSLPSEMQSVISMEIDQFGFNPKSLYDNSSKVKFSRDVIMSHSVYDTFGIENPVIGLSKKFLKDVGVFECRLLLPGIDFITNYLGGDYQKSFCNPPEVSFQSLIKGVLDSTNKKNEYLDDLQNILLLGIDRMIVGSYYTPFSYAPVSISPSIIFNVPIQEGYFVDIYMTYIHSFGEERRGTGIKKNNISELVEEVQSLSEKESCKLLNRLLENINNKFLPVIVDGFFYNGSQYQGALLLRSKVSDMSLGYGFDAWYKSPSLFAPTINQSVMIEALSSACQLNIFFNFSLNRIINNFNFIIEVTAQAPVYAAGIGKEFGGKVQLSIEY